MKSQRLLILLTVGTAACGSSSTPAAPTPPGDPAVCALYPAQESSPYVLPYGPGHAFLVGRTTEHGGEQRFAIDFFMPIGTPVVASRSGTVIRVEAGFSDSDHQPLHENLVWIEHADGTVGRYFHLMQGGTRVDTGQTVAQGQIVGLSGNSGASTAPHLHLDVARCDRSTNVCHETLPLTFLNTRAHPCGLQVGEVYRANAR